VKISQAPIEAEGVTRQAIEIDGEAYWDGGYAGNPTITPLVRESDARDTILVQIIRASVPVRRDRRAKSSIA
jgi:predicted acylesterase/phospholipase RssA